MPARRRLAGGARGRAADARQRFELAARTLHAVSPLATLDRGYAIVTAPGGAVLREPPPCNRATGSRATRKRGFSAEVVECAQRPGPGREHAMNVPRPRPSRTPRAAGAASPALSRWSPPQHWRAGARRSAAREPGAGRASPSWNSATMRPCPAPCSQTAHRTPVLRASTGLGGAGRHPARMPSPARRLRAGNRRQRGTPPARVQRRRQAVRRAATQGRPTVVT